MKKLTHTFIMALFVISSQAQISTAYKTQVETIFQVNRSHVTTGLLEDYGFFYTNVEKFNGARSDTRTHLHFKYFSIFIKTFS